jgi:hypothetical protein
MIMLSVHATSTIWQWHSQAFACSIINRFLLYFKIYIRFVGFNLFIDPKRYAIPIYNENKAIIPL